MARTLDLAAAFTAATFASYVPNLSATAESPASVYGRVSTQDENYPCSLRAIVDGEPKSFSTVAEKIDELANVWRAFNSGRPVAEFNHAAYMQIVGIGKPAVPELLRRLAVGESDWFVALKYITGAKVTTSEMRGNFNAIRDAWLSWGSDNGFGTKLL